MQKVRANACRKGVCVLGLLLFLAGVAPGVLGQPLPGGTLDPTLVPKFVEPLVKPPVFPAGKLPLSTPGQPGQLVSLTNPFFDYYEIAVRQFKQQILPPGFAPETTVWSYGPANDPRTVAQGGSYHYPAFTIEARASKPVIVKWMNKLVDQNGNFLPHLLPVDQTLHWANPPGPRDAHGTSQEPYTGPVPLVTHVHGAHTFEQFDGNPEAWFLPAAKNIPAGFYRTGTFYDYFKKKYHLPWQPGTATFAYPNDQRAGTLWYHDHALGMTRVNVYAGPAGFYLLRGGPDDRPLDSRTNRPAVLPSPAPKVGSNPLGTFYEIPLAIQDRSFNADGSLFYAPNRAFFEGVPTGNLQIPFAPSTATCTGAPSDVPPLWNPEFFGNCIVVNGRTWPYLEVEQRRYRFRLLDGSDARFLILKFDHPDVKVWWIGTEGGFLPAPVDVNAATGGRILLGPAERADLIVDFTDVPVNTRFRLLNLGPDGPLDGLEVPPEPIADPDTTGQVMEFRVGPIQGTDNTTPPQYLKLPTIRRLNPTSARRLSLNELSSQSVRASASDNVIVQDCVGGEPFGPVAVLLGVINPDGTSTPKMWSDAITENPPLNAVETWELYNFTADAHPIHIHEVLFQVIDRQELVLDADGTPVQPVELAPGTIQQPQPWETGFKDTVITYPGQVTRIKAKFDLPGFYVWHCHIVEHEDNEMMRPYHVGPIPANAPVTPPAPMP